jgi:hypothetical protein
LEQELVQREKKADSLLVIEIPAMALTWTDRCMAKEKANGADAPGCWRDAAAAVDEYASGFDGSLIEQIYRLQSTWLRRAGQLQSSGLTPIEKKPPVAVDAAAIAADEKGGGQSASTQPVQKKPRPKVAAGQGSPEADRSAKQRKQLTASGKPPQKPARLTKTREVNVVPAASVVQETRLKKLRPRKDAAQAGDTGEAPSKIWSIGEELEGLAAGLDCLFGNCAEGAN